ncbi:M-phase phosphoprotein 8 isoform X2 [Eucyclogobius newberryi]|uniref:M-phase phosphoprotein 8 isoform X2 n=1 Tax=Eucyclogobius newberryi TaxID=166745 RepID=UPI003B5C5849
MTECSINSNIVLCSGKKKRKLTLDKRKHLLKQGHAVGLRNRQRPHRVTTRSTRSKTAIASMEHSHTRNTHELLSKPSPRSKSLASSAGVKDADHARDKKRVNKQPSPKCNTAVSSATRTGLRSAATDVACALHVPKASKIRLAIGQIHNKRDEEKVPKKREGDSKPKKQTNNETSSTFDNKQELREHEQLIKTENDCVLSSTSPQFLSEECEEIIHIMTQDHITRHIQKDTFICKYGKALSAKHNHDKSQFPYIAQTMRELGRFVLAVNELDGSVQFLQDILLPTKFELAVEGAKKAIGFDPSSSTCKSSSLVSQMGSSLKRAAEVALNGNQMEDYDSELKTFIDLLEAKWNTSFSPCVLAPVKEEPQKMNTSTVTPDLAKLYQFISQEEEDARKDILQSPTLSTWKKLSEATLADVCLFNRIRVGNIGRLLLETYTCRRSTGAFFPSADQIRKSTKLELELNEQLTSLELEGQFGRSMLVVLTQRMVSLIDLLIEHRDQVGVSQSNLYLFARTEGPSFIRGLDCLRRAAIECGVLNPEALLCPSLRQQIASSWQLLSLCESDLDTVSKLMERGSQECSQLSQNTTLFETVSKQLLQMNRILPTSTTGSPKDGAQSKCPVKRRPWSEQEQAAVRRFLSEFITKMKVPGKKECNACLAAEPDLCRRSWTDIKNFVHNTLQTLKRRQNQPEKPKPERTTVKPKRLKAVTQSSRKHSEMNNNIYTNLITNLEDSPTPPSHSHVTEQFPVDLSSVYVSFCSASSDMGYSNPTCSFSSPKVLDTQVVPTYTQLGTINTVMQPAYSPESRYLTSMSPSNPHDPSSVAFPFVDLPLDTELPEAPAFTSLNCPSTSMLPTYTTLSTAIFPPYSPMNDRNDFEPLDHSSSYYTSSSLTPITCSQVVPAEEGMFASSERLSSLVYSQHSSDKKRGKMLSPEEEQDSMRRQLGDFELVKVPSEPVLNRFSLQPEQRRAELEPCIQTLRNEWDPPVYLSL